MNRRRFIESASLLTGGRLLAAGLTPSLVNAMAGGAGTLNIKMGVQIYMLRDLLEKNPVQAIKLISEIGYKEVEFAGLGWMPMIPDAFYGMSPQKFRSVLDDYNLVVPASGWAGTLAEIPKSAEQANILGCDYLIMGMPLEAISKEGKIIPFSSLDQVKKLAESINKIGEKCQEYGLRFAYHNHDFELLSTENEIPLDILVKETNPELVSFELDLGWVTAAGKSPREYLKKYANRISHCHVKDYNPDKVIKGPVPADYHAAMRMVSPGKGINDFGKIFEAMRKTSVKHAFVECDMPDDTEQVLRESYSYINKFLA